MSRRMIAAFTMGVALLGLVGVYVFWRHPGSVQRVVPKSLFAPTYQFLLVAVVGGAVSALYQFVMSQRESDERARAHEEKTRRRERELLLETHANVVSAYNAAKQARRLLRARAVTDGADLAPGGAAILGPEYAAQMEVLIQAQLHFESILRSVRANASSFGAIGDLAENLGLIENYLNATVQEFQIHYPQFEGDPPRRILSELPALQAFIGPFDWAEEFDTDFRIPFRATLRSLESAAADLVAPDPAG